MQAAQGPSKLSFMQSPLVENLRANVQQLRKAQATQKEMHDSNARNLVRLTNSQYNRDNEIQALAQRLTPSFLSVKKTLADVKVICVSIQDLGHLGFRFLPLSDLIVAQRVCKKWNAVLLTEFSRIKEEVSRQSVEKNSPAMYQLLARCVGVDWSLEASNKQLTDQLIRRYDSISCRLPGLRSSLETDAALVGLAACILVGPQLPLGSDFDF